MSQGNDPSSNGGNQQEYYHQDASVPQYVYLPQDPFVQPRPPANLLTLEQVESLQRFHTNISMQQGHHSQGLLIQANMVPSAVGYIDISNSNLQPTAQEFQPSAFSHPVAVPVCPQPNEQDSVSPLAHTGAVRRSATQPHHQQFQEWNQHNFEIAQDSSGASINDNSFERRQSGRFERPAQRAPRNQDGNVLRSHNQGYSYRNDGRYTRYDREQRRPIRNQDVNIDRAANQSNSSVNEGRYAKQRERKRSGMNQDQNQGRSFNHSENEDRNTRPNREQMQAAVENLDRAGPGPSYSGQNENRRGQRRNERNQDENVDVKSNQRHSNEEHNNSFTNSRFKNNRSNSQYNNAQPGNRERNRWKSSRGNPQEEQTNWRQREEQTPREHSKKKQEEKGNTRKKDEEKDSNKKQRDERGRKKRNEKEEKKKPAEAAAKEDSPTHEITQRMQNVSISNPEKSADEKVSPPLRDSEEFKKKLNEASQHEYLAEMVTHRLLDCIVCYERLRHVDEIWSCEQCYQITHLRCVQQWSRSSQHENSWRCPACQHRYIAAPKEYRCFCDKQLDPKFEPGILPHSCGEPCGRQGRNCEHKCLLLCHPGRCPDCSVIVDHSCGCGRTKVTVKCSARVDVPCDEICDKILNCSYHKCTAKCHMGECKPCSALVYQECFCGQEGRKTACTTSTFDATKYFCGSKCNKTLSCGVHKCDMFCHLNDCQLCVRDPQRVSVCACRRTPSTRKRTRCLSPLDTCDKICGKPLGCGPPAKPHLCEEKCHDSECKPCIKVTLVRCLCGHLEKGIPCKDLAAMWGNVRCQKKCTKRRTCMKHKCNQLCCNDTYHLCLLPCQYFLSCGRHRCNRMCHSGRCPPCLETSFEELYCACGANVMYPPIPCGTRPPECQQPCPRSRPCGHEPHHTCHMGVCPPCSVFTTRWCFGKHETRSTIPCRQGDFSCGMPCNKALPCGHKCIKKCHKGRCQTPCQQPCTIPRSDCEHNCNQPCHEPPCPTTACKQTVTVTCQCGLRSSTRTCMDLPGEYQKIAMIQLASKMADIQRGQSVEIDDIVNKQKRGGTHRTLECNDECRLAERNRRLAIGLQIRNPDLSSKLTPRYSEFMKQWGKKDPKFCQMVHDKLTELVKLAKESKHKSRSHSFDCMNRDKRHFVHEYCQHFGCDSAAYDAEPNRNVVATAIKEKSWLPSCGLIELLQRESGQRKVPGPVLNRPSLRSNAAVGSQEGESVSVRLQSQARSLEPRPPTPPATECTDYFNNPPPPR